MDNFALLIIGIYTLLFLITILIFQKQINSYKSVFKRMMNLVDFFKTEEIDNYGSLKEELLNLKLDSVLTNKEELNKIAKAAVSDLIASEDRPFNKEIVEMVDQQQSKQIAELSYFVAKILAQEPKYRRDTLIEKELKSAERIIKATLTELE